MKRKVAIRSLGLFSALLFLASAFGCSGSNSSAGLGIVDSTGNHAPNFVMKHPPFTVPDASACTSCHGSNLRGGISGVSCFTATCHHGTVPGWALSATHGADAKRAPGNSGFASCQICHANDFTGGGSNVSCLNNAACHGSGVNAPHPRKPWHSATAANHATTDPANAPVCSRCHFPGSSVNPTGYPSAPAPAGTAPGCFNSTLCHGANAAPHILGTAWTNPTSTAFHGLEAKKNLATCQSCHGTSGTILFDGGGATTKCSTCHTVAKAHPTTWYNAPVATFPGYVPSHRDALNKDTTCTICHDFTMGRTAPDPSSPSCFSASYLNAEHASVGCHVNGPGQANHSVPYLTTAHTGVAQSGFDSGCGACHAVTGSSPLSTAPLCTVCHTAGSPLTLTNCTSCHVRPPTGSVFPNVAGTHAKHNALPGVAGVCTACHNSFDTGSQAHYDHANARPGKNALRVPPGEAAFLATYNAKSGAASFNNSALTCSNVSCHGGQTAPNWQTGTINTATQCTSCHALGTAQFNSYNSGEHNRSDHRSRACTVCHNTTTLAVNHFTRLGTTAMEGPASATIGGGSTTVSTYVPSTGSCTPSNTSVCHSAKSW